MFPRISVHGRIVDRITSDDGQLHYYDHFNYWRSCVSNTNPVISPTPRQAIEYQQLIAEKDKLDMWGNLDMRRKYRKLALYNCRYDWRPHLSGDEGLRGLILPDGRELLPEKFVDIFTQFDAFNHLPHFIPVFNGEAWGLIAPSSPLIMVTDFIYAAIIPERWEHSVYFVQDKATLKWGALGLAYPNCNLINRKIERVPLLKQIMPPIADEILEDELQGDCAPTVFWMTRISDKIGILTPYGYSDIKYDTYKTDDENFLFHMIRHDRKRAKMLDYNFLRYKH